MLSFINHQLFFMIKHIVSFAALIAVITILCWQSCVRPDVQPMAGKGGKATLIISAMHHEEYADSLMCYLKYNATDLPADKKFDDSARLKLKNGKPVATFIGLKKGTYLIYCEGYDRAQFEDVKGASPYTIKEETIQEYSQKVGPAL
jgi:hypothetical protein